MVDIRGLGVPIDDIAPDDNLFEQVNLDAFPDTFNPNFAELERFKSIVKP